MSSSLVQPAEPPGPGALPVAEPTNWAPMARKRLGDVLVAAGVLSQEELTQALAAQRAVIGSRRRLGHVLVDMGFCTEKQIAAALGEQLHLQVVDLRQIALSPETVRLLPRSVAQRLGILIVSREGTHLAVAVSDPTDVVAMDDVRLHTGATELTVLVATETQVRDHLARVWSLAEDASDVSMFFEEQQASAPEPADPGAGNIDDAPTVRLVTMVLADAVRVGASDIHIEPQRDALRVRFRVDGVLRDVMTAPRSAIASVTSRLKIVSGLDIAERRLPQDGRTRITVDGSGVDARVSTMPSLHGEKVVIRLMTREDQVPSLDRIGMDDDQLQALRAALATPQGLILITGPTGSGKTNTLYSSLAEVHTPERNIVTLEDPVEVQLPGITQVQVHERSGLTFGRALRAVLRQDPDVVLVGEVRDTETAELAVRASLTGHLVLTTLHTNSAVSAITRLVDMGVEPFLAGSSLTAVVAQRLVRRPCASCVVPDEPDPVMLQAMGIDPDFVTQSGAVKGAGCPDCGGSGYKGRVGIFEVLSVDQQMRRTLTTDPTESAILAAAGDMPTLRDSAIAKALAGETTFDEVARVSPRE